MAVPVIDLTTSVLGYSQWETWSYQPWATNLTSSNTWTSSPLPPGMSLNAATGAISGYCTTPGVYVVGLRVTNANGTSDMVKLTIGIEAKAASNLSGVDLFIDVSTGEVTTSIEGAKTPAAEETLFSLKEGDDLVLYLHFVRNGTEIDFGGDGLSEIKFGMKEFEPDQTLVLSAKFKKGISTAALAYAVYVHFDSIAFKTALADNEGDASTSFNAICEIAWREPNVNMVGVDGVPTTLQRRSRTFTVFAERNLVPAA